MKRSRAMTKGKPSKAAMQWLERNPWFGVDMRLTAVAMAKHDRLVQSGRVVVDSEGYYAAVDRVVKRVWLGLLTDEKHWKGKR